MKKLAYRIRNIQMADVYEWCYHAVGNLCITHIWYYNIHVLHVSGIITCMYYSYLVL